MIRVTFGTITKLKADEGLLVYKGEDEKEAKRAEEKFVKNMDMSWDYNWASIIDNNTKIIDFGSHTLFLKEVTS